MGGKDLTLNLLTFEGVEPGLCMGERVLETGQPTRDYWLIQSGSDRGLNEGQPWVLESGGHA